jgi:RNA polymerase sigma factor (sigma-70 family)
VPFADLPESVGDDPAEASEVRFAVREVLEGLSPLDRAVLVLRHSEDLSVEDVAQRLGLSPGAVRNRSMRALARARERAVRWTIHG